ncbi:Sodium:alanine symporter family protein [hydrothermal vent metagenome]|uniref:Sodium:alanine symporter family protein n=1 Tax=hydrothermal vent metagenome TaxID=652676 RepID=A0A3B0S8V6_9ZZZZ
METIQDLLGTIDGMIWGPPLVLLLFGTGLYLTVGMRFLSIRRLPVAIKLIFSRNSARGEGEISPVAALFTALSATVGTGNIAGVATAIVLGGPGAVFWMWMTAVVGMATKYAEALLAVRFREVDDKGQHVGGPMYYIKNGMGKNWIWLAWAFAILTAIAAPGTGNLIQANEVAGQFQESFGIARPVTGAIMAVMVFAVIIGGVKSIARVATILVPFMAIAYVLAASAVLMMNFAEIPAALGEIFARAFTPTAAGGGFLGGWLMIAMREGANRGSFSNEAGLGSAAIAHASAQTDDPVRQGTIAMLGTFIDTILVCTMTALVILTATGDFKYSPAINALGTCDRADALPAFVSPDGSSASNWLAWAPPADQLDRKDVIREHGQAVAGALQACRDAGVNVEQAAFDAATDPDALLKTDVIWRGHYSSNSVYTSRSFGASLPGGEWIVTIGLAVFAFTTMLGWALYGERSITFMFGTRVIVPYRIFWCVVVYLGATWTNNTAWTLASIGNGLMAGPNLIALLGLSGVVFAMTREDEAKRKALKLGKPE